jgi:hypothetical protein
MRCLAVGSGPPADQLNALAIQLRGMTDLPEIEYRWPRIMKALENLAARVAAIRHRGGQPVAIDAPLTWLKATIREHPALQEPRAGPLRTELLIMVHRIDPRRSAPETPRSPRKHH